jgi:hypothetical protein
MRRWIALGLYAIGVAALATPARAGDIRTASVTVAPDLGFGSTELVAANALDQQRGSGTARVPLQLPSGANTTTPVILWDELRSTGGLPMTQPLNGGQITIQIMGQPK